MRTTWKGDPTLKCSVVTNLIRHRAADNFVRGYYAGGGPADFSGCALGCTLVPFGATVGEVEDIKRWVNDTYDDWADATAARYGLPRWLTRLEETVFESINDFDWPADFASAVPVGVPFRELKLRVHDELKRRVKAREVRNFAQVVNAQEVDDVWGGEKVWEPIRDDLLELLRGIQIDVPQPDCSLPAEAPELEKEPVHA